MSIIIFMIVPVLSGFMVGNNFYFIAHISAGKEAGDRIAQFIATKT